MIDRGDGRPLNPDTLSAGSARYLRHKELPQVRFHDLRHAHATLMLTQGVHPKVVSERLGHASIGITLDLYSHVLPSLQTEAASIRSTLSGRRLASLKPVSPCDPFRTPDQDPEVASPLVVYEPVEVVFRGCRGARAVGERGATAAGPGDS